MYLYCQYRYDLDLVQAVAMGLHHFHAFKVVSQSCANHRPYLLLRYLVPALARASVAVVDRAMYHVQ